MLYAPKVQEFQAYFRLDEKTRCVIMERHADYPGQDFAPLIQSPADLYDWFRHAGELASEDIFVVSASPDQRLFCWSVPHAGQLASVEASTRKMIRDALLSNTPLFTIAHNHPSGDPTPSEADRELTEVTARVADRLGMQLMDHMVFGQQGQKISSGDDKGYYSFHESDPKALGTPSEIKLLPPDYGTSEGLVDGLVDPEIDRYQFVTKFDMPSYSIVMERDGRYDRLEPAGSAIYDSRQIARMFRGMPGSDLNDSIILGALNVRNEIIGWTVVDTDEGHIADHDPEEIKYVIRTLIRDLMFANADAFFVVTAHDDSNPNPLPGEVRFVKAMNKVSTDLGTGFFDHVILANGSKTPYYSFRDKGALPEAEGY